MASEASHFSIYRSLAAGGFNKKMIKPFHPPSANSQSTPAKDTEASSIFKGDDDMSRRMRGHDWSATSLGPICSWPANLKTISAMVMDTPFPAVLWWGADLTQIYNQSALRCFDAFRDPAALGQSAAQCWMADWPTFARQLEIVLRERSAVRHQNLMIPILRDGNMQECYWTYSFTPIFGESDGIDGILVASAETTQRVLADRRQAALDHLRAHVALCQSRSEMAAQVRRSAARAARDILKVAMPGEELAEAGRPAKTIRAAEAVREHPFELRFHISEALPYDLPYQRFLEQFTDIVFSARQRLDAELSRSIAEAERDRLLTDAPVGAAVMVGNDLTYQLVNSIYAMVSGRAAENMVGKPFVEVFPELDGSPVHRKFLEVYQAGIPFVGAETLVQIHRHGGKLDDRYFTYNLSPLRRLDDSVYGLMVIAVDVTTQVEARTQIERLNAELNASSRAKDEFLALLGHELRNPLAPIFTALELMGMRDSATKREQALIQRQATHLVRLVDDLLDVSRITRGKVELRRERADLREVLGKAIEMIEPTFKQKRQVFDADIAAIDLFADPARIAQVASNLLTNASRYTQEGGRISLRAWRGGSNAFIEVSDDGSGIPPGLMERIFDPFVQGQRMLNSSVGGLGIGLALVKNLVDLHGGSVSAKSAGDGLGSSFMVSLPLAMDPLDQAPNLEPAQSEAAVVVTVDSQALDILVVDDNEDAANLLAELLAAWGHAPRVTYDPVTAIAACAGAAPDLAILDIGLPGMDGYQLAERLRALPGLDSLPCVALTGYGQNSDKAKSQRAGFAGHMVKPVDADALNRILRIVSAAREKRAA